ncbi:MAG: hypothetical protein DRQ40_09570 [Gammaproteobacteria bacterium]|nr:MAG: hypothetical protein DRQ40_09570 [Gammaproteobacteria bacterium]
MSRSEFDVEIGYAISTENGDVLVSQLSGAAAPGGDTGPQDDAGIGSIYQRTDGGLYRKITDTNATSDWFLMDQAADPNNYSRQTGVTTNVVLDSVVVDDVLASEWEIHVFEEATPANVKAVKIWATHDGSAAADAVNVDDTSYAKLRLGANFNVDLLVTLTGAAGAQVMQLSVTSSTAGVTVTSRRNDVKAP